MRRLLYLGLMVSLFGLVCAGAPTLKAEFPIHDFGCVPEGSLVYHKFLLRNVGDELLTISNVVSSCGCTVPSLPRRTLEPGASVSLQVTFRSEGYGGLAVTETIRIASNDPDAPDVLLALVGSVTPAGSSAAVPAYLTHFVQLLIDLRDRERFDRGHLLGAILVPCGDLLLWAADVPRSVPIALYDQDGTTSREAMERLQEAGFASVTTILGGYDYAQRSLDPGWIRASEE